MFTLNIRNIVAVGIGGVKWTTGPITYPEVAKKSLQSQIVDIGKSARDGVDFVAKRMELLQSASEDELKKLKEQAIAKKAGKTSEYNEKLRQDIQKVLDTKQAETVKATAVTAGALIQKVPEAKAAVVAAQVNLQK